MPLIDLVLMLKEAGEPTEEVEERRLAIVKPSDDELHIVPVQLPLTRGCVFLDREHVPEPLEQRSEDDRLEHDRDAAWFETRKEVGHHGAQIHVMQRSTADDGIEFVLMEGRLRDVSRDEVDAVPDSVEIGPSLCEIDQLGGDIDRGDP